jgi:hypothetical protein
MTMKGNQGLEALAALCGGQSNAPMKDARAADGFGSYYNDTATPTLGPQQSLSAQDAVHYPGQRQPPQQSPLQNVTQRQWQQAIAAAAALQGNGVNPALAAQSFLLSAGMSSKPQQTLGDNAFSTMQQLAFQQYVQQQASLSAQQAAQLSAQQPKTGVQFGDQGQHALMMALSAGKSQQMQHVHGESIDTFCLTYRYCGDVAVGAIHRLVLSGHGDSLSIFTFPSSCRQVFVASVLVNGVFI